MSPKKLGGNCRITPQKILKNRQKRVIEIFESMKLKHEEESGERREITSMNSLMIMRWVGRASAE